MKRISSGDRSFFPSDMNPLVDVSPFNSSSPSMRELHVLFLQAEPMGPHLSLAHMTSDGSKSYESEIPQFGLGVFLANGPDCKQAVRWALDAGYRHIDTARAYDNEKQVGEAILESEIERSEIFVTSKLRRFHAVGYDETIHRCKESLENLGLEYLDLFLVHAPPKDPYHRKPTWQGMEKCLETGLVRAIGVSNYGAHHLDHMRSYARYLPSVNQFEVHPWLQRPGLRAATEAIGAIPEAYSPLARGKKLDDPMLASIAKKIGASPAQVAIKWCLDQGCITIPKSTNKNRIEENLAALNLDISPVMAEISSLEENFVSGWDPTAEP
ncbi:MAG TPA: aldo/keto reductase [Candidatus Thalassarchaeaceae archaeon]|nr:aldo/keto reductase [Candidatus Thalassarchaeaceae archaeon]